MRIGYFLSSEECNPHQLVEQAALAEKAGFEGLWISDHYHPWNDAQGQSPFVWGTIGAISQVCRLPVTTAVTAPIVRIHPAVVAQAAATAAVQLSAEPESDKARFVIEVGGEVIGECSLHFFDDYARACHLGISIRRDKWGKGYGQDAVRTLVNYAFTYLNFRKVSLEVLADDERAIAAYSKAGFREEGRFREHNWHDGA